MGEQNRKGFILITSYLLLSVLSVFSLALFSRNTVFLQATERNENKIKAFNMAEAGVDYAITNLKANPNFSANKQYFLIPAENNAMFNLTVSIPATTPNGQPNTNQNIRQITVQGISPMSVSTRNSPNERGREIRTITTYVTVQPPSLFDYAVFAKESVHMSGRIRVDSYDSRNGPYRADKAGSKGHVGTDSARPGFVMLAGNVVVNGNFTAGPGGDPSKVLTTSGHSTVTGTLSAASTPENFEAEKPTGIDLGGLSLSGDTVYELPAGNYKVSSLTITGEAKLKPLGPVTIYSDGKVNIAGQGIVTSNNEPKNFLLYATKHSEVHVGGGANFYGGIYAPQSKVHYSGSGQFFGAVVSRTYHQSGDAPLHFDESLTQITGGSGNEVKIQSWNESGTTLGG